MRGSWMGCAATRTARRVQDAPPGTYVQIDLGKKVSSGRNEQVKVVLIFGGPGSKKGRIVDELAEDYGFRVIDVEELILKDLTYCEGEDPGSSDKIEYQERIHKAERIIRENPQSVSLEWILSSLNLEIKSLRQDGHKLCLVDFLPKLKFLLETETFSGQQCQGEMNKFEEMWPDMFAVNLASMKTEKDSTSKVPNPEGDIAEPGFSDEKDYLKTKSRQEIYSENAKDFLCYFRKRERLVTVDTSSGRADIISSRVARLFSELGFTNTSDQNNTLTVFLFDKREQVEVHEEFSSKTTLGSIFKPWKNHDRTQKPKTEVLVLDQQQQEIIPEVPKQVLFLHPVETTDGFNGAILSKRGRLFKAFSLTEHQVCFFPGLMTSEECGRVWRSRSLHKILSA